MRENKLIRTLKILSTEELKGFHNYVRSPYFTKSKEVVRLFDYIRKYAPDFDAPQLEKRKVFPKLFPNQAYSDIKLRNLFTKLYQIVENYLIQLHHEQDELSRKRVLTEIYRKRSYYVEFKKHTQQLLKLVAKQPYRDASYFYETYLTNKRIYFNEHTIQEGNQVETLKHAIDSLNEFYTLEQLQLNLELYNVQQIYNSQIQPNLPPLPKHTLENPIAIVLQNLIHLFQNNSYELFSETKELFLDNLQKIRKEDAYDILLILLNWTIRKCSENDLKYLQESFVLYKIGVAQHLLCTKEQIHEATYINIVIVGSSLKEFIWVDHFMKLYKDKLIGSHAADISKLTQAFYFFYQKNYTAAIQSLPTNKIKSNLYEINARMLALRIYYELFEQDKTYAALFQSHLESCTKFITRETQLNSSKLKVFLNFLKILKVIFLHKIDSTTIDKEKLYSMLHQQEVIINRNWLQEKIKAI